MGVNVQLSRAAFDTIVAQASDAGDEECCGLLLAFPGSAPGVIDYVLPAANVAANRRRHFEIDPATLIAAHRAERTSGPHIVGCYHSHPGGDATPSPEDAAQAEAGGSLWLICAGPPWTMTAWRTAPHGSGQDSFDAVAVIVTPVP